ncbi:hypothetical protein C0T31_11445 [Dysgonamonadaceae bacterium]|nr:hypothetical protein C0T31_11445 [Dysgonamonadaceae bacterium]
MSRKISAVGVKKSLLFELRKERVIKILADKRQFFVRSERSLDLFAFFLASRQKRMWGLGQRPNYFQLTN